MLVDVLFDPFGGQWPDLRDAAQQAEAAGFAGVWTYDHLAGSVHGEASVLECWTTLTALSRRRAPNHRSGRSCSTRPTATPARWP